MVTDEINRILKEKINATIQYIKIPWDDYGQRFTALINSGSECDVLYASVETDQGDCIGNAQNGARLALDDYLKPGAAGSGCIRRSTKSKWRSPVLTRTAAAYDTKE